LSRHNSVSRDPSTSRINLPSLGDITGAPVRTSEGSSQEAKEKSGSDESPNAAHLEDQIPSPKHNYDHNQGIHQESRGEASHRDSDEGDLGTIHSDQREFHIPPNRLTQDVPLSARAAAVSTGLPTSNSDLDEVWRRNRKIKIVDPNRVQ